LGPTDVIQLLNNVKAPFGIHGLTSKMAIKALDNTDKLEANIKALLDQRTAVEQALEKLDYVTFRLAGTHAKDVDKKMADEGVKHK
jgi:histidinol-phosphate/aromatic aminotransferase/cobyric acid decarboxylase-like protein